MEHYTFRLLTLPSHPRNNNIFEDYCVNTTGDSTPLEDSLFELEIRPLEKSRVPPTKRDL